MPTKGLSYEIASYGSVDLTLTGSLGSGERGLGALDGLMPAALRPAATVILLRDTPLGPEVWMMERNRAVVKEAIEAVGLRLADPASQISVARIELPLDGPDSSLLYKDMLARGVHVLPCAPFHWADPQGGLRYIRVSLARPLAVVEAAARTLAQSYMELSAVGAARTR